MNTRGLKCTEQAVDGVYLNVWEVPKVSHVVVIHASARVCEYEVKVCGQSHCVYLCGVVREELQQVPDRDEDHLAVW